VRTKILSDTGFFSVFSTFGANISSFLFYDCQNLSSTVQIGNQRGAPFVLKAVYALMLVGPLVCPETSKGPAFIESTEGVFCIAMSTSPLF